MRSSVRVRAAIVLAAAILGACASSSKPNAVARAAPTSFAELEARLVTKLPSQFVVQANDVGDAGPFDLAKAIQDEGANDGKVLRAEGFVRGYQRLWIGPEHAQIIVFVYQFESQVGARKNFARMTRGFDTKAPRGVHRFAVSFLPPAQAIGIAGADRDGSAAAVEFTTGVFSVQIICNGPTLPGLQARAVAVAEDQLRRL